MSESEDESARLERILARADELAPEGAETRACFALVVRGLSEHQLEPSDLPELVAELARGGAPGFQELLFEPWGERVRVRYVGEELLCPRDELVRALAALERA